MSQSGPSVGAEPHFYRKPTNRALPNKIEQIIPEAKLYGELLDSERRLDATIARKKLDLQDALARSSSKTQTLRVFVSNTVADQPWQATNNGLDDAPFDFDTGAVPSWTLKIEGRTVDGEKDNNGDGEAGSGANDESGKEDLEKRRLFSTFFTSIIVEVQYEDEADVPTEGAIAEWHEQVPGTAAAAAAGASPEFDALDIRRSGARNVKAQIQLQPKEYPTRFQLSPELASVLAIEEDTKAGVVVALWQYIRFHHLQDRDEKRLIKCDAPLRSLFGGHDTVSFPKIMELLAPHLLPRPPITLEYEIRVDKEGASLAPESWDIVIEVPDPNRTELAKILEGWASSLAEGAELDDQISLTVESLHASQLKWDFFRQLSQDPTAFTQRWVQSQARDLRILLSDRQFSEEEVRHSSFYTDELLGSTIQHFLNTAR